MTAQCPCGCQECGAYAAERIEDATDGDRTFARLAQAERERDTAIALAEGRLRVLNEKAEEARREWARAEAAEAQVTRLKAHIIENDLRYLAKLPPTTDHVVLGE